MDRRRADGAPALWRRVRWANVGRLAVLLAAAFLIVSGGKGCGSGSPPALPAPVGPIRAERPQSPPAAIIERAEPKPRRETAGAHSRQVKSDGQRPRRGRRLGRRRAGERREASALEQDTVAPAAPVEPAVAPTAPTPPPTPSGPGTPPPGPGPGEFTPDPGA